MSVEEEQTGTNGVEIAESLLEFQEKAGESYEPPDKLKRRWDIALMLAIPRTRGSDGNTTKPTHEEIARKAYAEKLSPPSGSLPKETLRRKISVVKYMGKDVIDRIVNPNKLTQPSSKQFYEELFKKIQSMNPGVYFDENSLYSLFAIDRNSHNEAGPTNPLWIPKKTVGSTQVPRSDKNNAGSISTISYAPPNWRTDAQEQALAQQPTEKVIDSVVFLDHLLDSGERTEAENALATSGNAPRYIPSIPTGPIHDIYTTVKK